MNNFNKIVEFINNIANLVFNFIKKKLGFQSVQKGSIKYLVLIIYLKGIKRIFKGIKKKLNK